ncbi:tRNA G18 (ribose-2'-O)-methylase SpoU [Mesorhizobium sp. J18]|uniref:TrmH family RNA methyltransferase n=1 Tax=Mesorhizobium sp. J18 TaxID=935263 RepID=UPI001199F2B1|nr:RNA methyltransferase [Mesorhizobium sp. J18]TWG97167.1 tRNA G18 (ribose-2'-O)-methylase SpoU [Mesorhizobium sp. J18]
MNNASSGLRQPIRIDDPADPRIAAYRDIRERDLVGRQGRFVAEGKVVLNVLFTARRFEAESVLLLENRLAGMESLLELIPEEVPVYVASAPVIDAIAGFHMHRGILAIGMRSEEETHAGLLSALPEEALVVALMGIANHDNMGAIFRNAAAFGADAVLLDGTCCDPLYRKAIRVSVGAALKVPFARQGSADELVSTLTDNGFEIVALTPAGKTEIADAARSRRMALLLGSEGEGLPRNVLERLKTVRIGMAEDFDSLNVAAASAIALHHMRHCDRRSVNQLP